MPLHPEAAAFLRALPADRAFPREALHDAEAADAYLVRLRAPPVRTATPAEPVAHVEDVSLRPDLHVRCYCPVAPAPRPILMYFHGGGWVSGDLDMHDLTCRRLTNLIPSVVVNVEYRLAPEHTYPCALDDCVAATQWAGGNAAGLGADPARLGVAGSSSGGNLAAAVALRVRDSGEAALALQILLYPVIDSAMATPSYRENGEGFFLEANQMRWFWEQYAPNPADRTEQCASPAHATDLEGLPPAIVATAQYDPLRDEAEAYADRLRRSRVPVQLLRYHGQIHGFIGLLGILSDAEHALTDIAAAARQFLLPSPGRQATDV